MKTYHWETELERAGSLAGWGSRHPGEGVLAVGVEGRLAVGVEGRLAGWVEGTAVPC